EEEEEAATPGPEQLATDRAAAPRLFVEVVDAGGRDPGGQRPLEHPALVQQLAKSADVVAAGQDRQPLVDHLVHRPQRAPAVADGPDLLGGDVGGVARLAGVDQQQVLLELVEAAAREDDRRDVPIAVAQELDPAQAAEGGDRLILAADVLADQVL